MDNDNVDVIIPTYNRAYCLAEAIDSVLAQTHRNCRAIVVDDGSTDSTRQLIQDRYGSNPQVLYVYQTNGGVSAARNTGLSRATGDFVALLDSDDSWKPWKIALQLECLKAVPLAGMVWTDMSAIDAKGKVVKERYLKTMYGAYRRHAMDSLFENSQPLPRLALASDPNLNGARLYWGDIFSQMVSGNLVHTSTVLLTRERARRVGGFSESLKHSGEDFDFHLRTCREGPVAFADAPSIYYRIGNEDQLTQAAYHVHIAKNYLKTIVPIIESDRARIKLSDSELRKLVANAHAWVSYECFRIRDYQGARRHALASVEQSPWQQRMWLVLAVSLLPTGVRDTLMQVYRGLRNG